MKDFSVYNAAMNFIADLDLYEHEKPYNCMADHLEGGEITNLRFDTVKDVVVKDVRSQQRLFTLEDNGFTFVEQPMRTQKAIGSLDFFMEYLEETVTLLREYFKCEKVICYDLRVRKNVPKAEVTGDRDDRSTAMFAVQDVHIDQTVTGGFQRIKRHVREDEVADLTVDDWQALIVNCWRPLNHPVEDAPLAFCDYRTVDHKDLLAADRVYGDYNGEIYYMKHNSKQQWHYMSQQKPHEIALFVSFMSDAGDEAQFCPHVSFQNPHADPTKPPRESIEVRAILFRKKDRSA